jgi:hypothetical protein
VLSTSSKELGTRHQTPTLIGCIFLRNQSQRISSLLSCFAVISRALNSSTVFKELSNFKVFRFSHPSTAICNQLQQRSLELYTEFKPDHNSKPNLSCQPPDLPKNISALPSPLVYAGFPIASAILRRILHAVRSSRHRCIQCVQEQ